MEVKNNRSFGGVLSLHRSDFPNRAQRNNANKHLKAYLRGDKTYISGYNNDNGIISPIRSRVIEIWN